MNLRLRLLLAVPLGALLSAALPDLPPGHTLELKPNRTWTDELGQTHSHYLHRINGLRVWGSELIDHSGATPATNHLALAHAAAVPPPPAAAPAVGEAILWPEYVEVPVQAGADATHMDRDVVGYRNAVLIPAGADDGGPAPSDYILDADTGEVLAQIPAEQTDTAAKGVGRSLYQGRVTVDTAFNGTKYQLQDLTRGKGGGHGFNSVWDARGTTAPVNVYSSPVNTWGDGASWQDGAATDSANGQTMAVDVAYGFAATWDYYVRIHGRNGPDGLGTAVRGVVHDGRTFDNAAWLTSTMTFSVNQPRVYEAMTDLDTIGHELSHGVIGHSARLIYLGESGALNEATADIFGAMVSTWKRNGAGASIGDTGTRWGAYSYPRFQAKVAPPIAWRDYIKPAAGVGGPDPDAWSADIGKLDVHHSSGPMNRAFYFLSQGAATDPGNKAYSPLLPGGMTGIGNDKAARIWYRALTSHLTAASDYADARAAALTAAGELYGSGPEAQAVAKAFAAINVGSADSGLPTGTATLAATATLAGSQLNLAATATGPINRVNYYVDGLFVGQAGAPGFTLTLSSDRLFANGPHGLTAKGYSPAGLEALATEVSFTLANPVQQLLVNGGFEGELKGWKTYNTDIVQFDPAGVQAHSGYRWARIGHGAFLFGDEIKQTVTIPAGSAYAQLEFWLRTRLDPSTSGIKFRVAVTPDGGAAPATWDFQDDAEPGSVWVHKQIDVSAFAGQKVTLALTQVLRNYAKSSFDVDDVRLVCGAGVPRRVTLDPEQKVVYSGAGPVTLAATVTGLADPTVTWTAPDGGSVDAAGTFTAPAQPGRYRVRATANGDPTVQAEAEVLVKPLLAWLPERAGAEPGETLALYLDKAPAIVPILSVSGGPDAGGLGPLDASGRVDYTAPATPGSYLATAQDPVSGASASATIRVHAPVRVTVAPALANLAGGAGQQFTAEVQGDPAGAVTWSVQEGSAGGTINSSGLYAAPAAAGTYHVVATSVLDPRRSAVASVTVTGTVAIEPAKATLLTGASLSFYATVPGHANQAVTWSLAEGAAAGSLQGASYTAPAKPGTYTLVATSTANPALSARATIVVKTIDFNGSGAPKLNFSNLARLADAWQAAPVDDAADLNGDGKVDDADVALFFSRFGGQP